MPQARAALHRHFGYPDFRPAQAGVVRSVLTGRDTLAVLPTGAGKSVCFQVPAVVLGGLTLVVSPLISLMQDQVAAAGARGIPAAALTSGLTAEEQAAVWDRIEAGCAPPAVPLARAAGADGGRAARARSPPGSAGGGRGPLHRRVGARLPAQLPPARCRALPPGPPAGRRAHRQRDAWRTPGDHPVARPPGRSRGGPSLLVRSHQSLVRRGPGGRARPAGGPAAAAAG